MPLVDLSNAASTGAIGIKCSRCRHRHFISDRVDLPSKEWPGASDSCCPRCKARTYEYDVPVTKKAAP